MSRQILRPKSLVYESGSDVRSLGTTSLESLNTFGFELLGGLGFSYPVSFKASVFFEAMYTHRLNSMISDGTWDVGTLGANLGLLWRL